MSPKQTTISRTRATRANRVVLWLLVLGVSGAGLILGCKERPRGSQGPVGAEPVVSKSQSESASSPVSRLRFEEVPGALLGSEYRDGSEQGVFSLVETTGGGSALIDYDRDGKLDVVTSGGGSPDASTQRMLGHPGGLYRQVDAWKFDPCRESAFLDFSATYHSAIVAADYDSDGMSDLVVTGFDRLQWFRNQGDGTFETVQPIEDSLWSTAAVFF